MKFTSKDVSAMLEELKSHDDVIGHASTPCTYNPSVYSEDACGYNNGAYLEDRK